MALLTVRKPIAGSNPARFIHGEDRGARHLHDEWCDQGETVTERHALPVVTAGETALL